MLLPGGVNLLFGPDILPPGHLMDVAEDSPSYAGNAMKKAFFWALRLGMAALADDSGLEVRSLGWAPGVMSARVAPDDRSRIDWLLERLEGFADRRARFVAALALFDAGRGTWLLAEGFCPGVISSGPSGDHGFGYDPVFVPEGYEKPLAILGPDVKSRVSHRAIAAGALSRMLEKGCMVEYGFV
ncbi:MAG: non-canonical purine NTP pyrophosphatase [Thermovirgaceae bacterium]|nr:non-canonical purine NTP pyrophosphatase [Thermovirgaceae bacterium]